MASTLAYYISKAQKNFTISNNLGQTICTHNLTEILDFFLAVEPQAHRFVWNLYQVIGLLQDLLPKSSYNELIEKDRTWYEDYKLFSSAGRIFSITHKKHLHDNFYEPQEINLFHLCQYFPEDNVHDANDVYNKAVELISTLKEMGLEPNKFSSAVAMYDECILSKCDLPNIYNLPDNNALEASEYAHHIGWRELRACYKIGHWAKTWDADISGAYPSIMSNLPDTRNMKCWYVKNYQKCDFGIFKGKINITSEYSPIVDEDGIPFKGIKDNFYLTTEQWGFINHFKLGCFEPYDGWLINFTSLDKPFHELMNDLYDARGESGLWKRIPKSISVGIGGRLAQEYPERYGELFNPILQVMTTSRVSLNTMRIVLENNLQDNLISLIVDGCLFDTNPNINTGTKLGEWKVSEPTPALVLSLAFQWLLDKKPANQTYRSMKQAISSNPNKSFYNGIFFYKDLATNRQFDKFPKTGRDLLNNIYQSRAIEA